jgi:lauroyl/myristoyl acyltransferase
MPLVLPLLYLPRSFVVTTRYSLHSRISDLARLPSSLRPTRHVKPRAFVDRLRTELNQCSWPYREHFLADHWRRRIRWHGAQHVDRALSQGRGIILATLHYGPLTFLARWLCARAGHPRWRLASLVDDPSWMDPRRRDSSGRRIAPRIIRHDQLRRAHRFLENGGILLVGVDFPRGKTISIQIDDRVLPIATGALRLAAATGAAVIPILALERWWWRGEVRISQPIPNDLVANPANHTEACGYIVHELMKIVRQHPLQSAELMLRQFQDASPAP